MAHVSISEAARLVNVSRPTLYKLLNSGKLSYTSVMRQGKVVKNIDTAELLRVFGSLVTVKGGDSEAVKIDSEVTDVNSPYLQDLQHQIALLNAENKGLKASVEARDAHIDSLKQAMLLIEHQQKQSIRYPRWQFWKKS